MKVLITGASSGLGKEITIYLDNLGYETIIVSRDKKTLSDVKKQLKNNCKIIIKDLSNVNEAYELYDELKKENIDFVVNNAGIGQYGEFINTDINKDISMINLNIISVNILTKLFLKDMIIKNKGRILNISSLASFTPGPLMASYYATKAYVTNLTLAIHKELKGKNSKVKISCLCPGPIDTNFNKELNIKFVIKSLSAKYVAKYTIDNCLKGKTIIIPGFKNKIARIFTKLLPLNILLDINYNIQKKKEI